ncbi:MAG: hypothetical protein COA82_10600 [Alkaliphilus sp.]|nr:MAG: hypothetical protein COA82_10600 [Alkaliphilus sp.]
MSAAKGMNLIMSKKSITILLGLININLLFLTISIYLSSSQLSSYIDQLTDTYASLDYYIVEGSSDLIRISIIINIGIIMFSLLLDTMKIFPKYYMKLIKWLKD